MIELAGRRTAGNQFPPAPQRLIMAVMFASGDLQAYRAVLSRRRGLHRRRDRHASVQSGAWRVPRWSQPRIARPMADTRRRKFAAAALALAMAVSGDRAAAQSGSTSVERATPPGQPSGHAEVRAARAAPKQPLVATGLVDAANRVLVRCDVPGGARIVSLVPAGSRVKKGQIVCELDSTEIKRRLLRCVVAEKQAKAAYQEAREARQTAEKVNTRIAGRGSDEADRRLAWEKLRAEVDELWTQFRACTIVSPIDGPVEYVGTPPASGIRPGAGVRRWQVLCKIADLRELVVVVNLTTKDLERVRVGQKARIRVDVLPQVHTTGVVRSVDVLPNPAFVGGNAYAARVKLDTRPPKIEARMPATVVFRSAGDP
jgi:multidrug efflux pump subunit AcrA (membrane-fusion protein)